MKEVKMCMIICAAAKPSVVSKYLVHALEE
jgi:hypothetical protein